MNSAVILFAVLASTAQASTWDDRMFAADRDRAAGHYAEAADAYRAALAQATAGRQQAIAANNLASLDAELGRTADALRLYRQALDIWQRTLPSGAPEIATTLNNLGALYAVRHRYKDADYYYQRALAIQPQPSTLNNLAELYFAQGRYTEAERLLRRLIDTLPAADPTLGTALHNMGELCRRKGRPAEAGEFYHRALAVWDQTLGPDHPYRAATLRNLAQLESAPQGKVAVAAFR